MKESTCFKRPQIGEVTDCLIHRIRYFLLTVPVYLYCYLFS